MKKNKSENKKQENIIQKIESIISEGFQGADIPLNSDKVTNAFGRPVLFSNSRDIATSIGTSSTGLRTAINLEDDELVNNIKFLSYAACQHLAMVIHNANCSHPFYNMASETGCAQLFASSSQEVIDFALISRRIAELSLIPTICASDILENNDQVIIPEDDFIHNYLGNPDEMIESPTASQRMIFGNNRRRIPIWFNLNFPSANGLKKDIESEGLQIAAKQEYFYAHLADLTNQAFNEFNELTGKQYSLIGAYQLENAEHVVLTQGSAFNKVKKVVDNLRSQGRKVGCVNLTVMRPFPEAELLKLLNGKKSITILENMTGSLSGNTYLYEKLLAILYPSKMNIEMLSGLYFSNLSEEDIIAVFDNMSSNIKQRFYLGVNFTKEATEFPKHDILIGNIKREYPNIQDISLTSSFKEAVSQQIDYQVDLPYTVRQYKDGGPAYTKLSRFYDDVALFHSSGIKGELIADPFQSLSLTPASTANFFDFTKHRAQVPVFNPSNCTGCGSCFVNCPHSALPPISISIPELIKSGLEIASKKGVKINKITPLVKNISKVIASEVSKNLDNDSSLVDYLQKGFSRFTEQAGLPEDKLKIVSEEFDQIVNAVSLLPIAVTELFFEQQNLLEKGSGEFFSLAVDPISCTACGVCVSSCDNGSLTMVDQTQEVIGDLQNRFKLWELLPDTPSGTIKRLHQSDTYNPFAAIMLSRNYYMSMSGGTKGSECEPSKQTLHLVSSLLESVLQPNNIEQSKVIENHISELNKNIHNKLVENLPSDDFSVLEKAIKKASNTMTPFDQIINEIGKSEIMNQLDTHAVQRKIDLCNLLKELKWILTEGPTGCGRSRFSMAINSKGCFNWVNNYPANVFSFPVIIGRDKITAGTLIGSFNGQMRYILDNIKLLRRAELEIKDKYDNDLHGQEIASLSWKDLSSEEKKLIPPIIYLTDSNSLNNTDELYKLLSGDFPIKVVLIDDAKLMPGLEGVNKIREKTAFITSVMTLKNAFVMQGSAGDSSHVFNGLHKGMLSSKPALFVLYASDINGHSTALDSWTSLPWLASASRTVPLIKYDPGKESTYFGTAIDLSDNPSADQLWHSENIIYSENNDEKEINYKVTWADWAYSQVAWKDHFEECSDDRVIRLSEFISLDHTDREGKTPVIIRVKEGGLVNYKVSDEVILTTEVIAVGWQNWREMAGMITEFPKKLKTQVTKELSSEYEEKVLKLKAEFEDKLKGQEHNQNEIMRARLREKLSALSSKSKN